jgi:dimethylargininase
MMLVAITRGVSPSINRCELTDLERVPIDLEMARQQHRRYEAALESLGVEVRPLAAEAELPDSVFVEDTAVVLDECAVITRPGAASRRPETASIAHALAPHRNLFHVRAPGTLDGGDVLCLGKRVYVGLSMRSNQSGVDQLQAFLVRYGYAVAAIRLAGCLHLKSAVTQVAADTLLINPACTPKAHFSGMKFIEVDPAEPRAANALMIAERVIYQPAFPKTCRRLEQSGMQVMLVDGSELGKAEGGLTCCSLIFKAEAGCM